MYFNEEMEREPSAEKALSLCALRTEHGKNLKGSGVGVRRARKMHRKQDEMKPEEMAALRLGSKG